jgi:hypothetical protein
MRTFIRLMSTMLVIGLFAAFTSASGANAATANPTIRIAKTTSPMYQYYDVVENSGTFPAVTVSAVAKNCRPGGYYFSATLVQDGVSAQPAMSGAMGWSAVTCVAGQDLNLSLNLFSPTLHSGAATATFTLQNESTNLSKTAKVRIP